MASIPGTSGNDPLTGTSADDTFQGSAGNDTIIGGGGNDYINYGGFTGPVTVTFGVTLYSGTTGKPGGTSDIFSGIRGVFGTTAGDTLIGTDADGTNAPYSILLRGGAGNDTIDGRNLTINQANYMSATTGVTVNLQNSIDGSGNTTGSALDGQGGTDTLINVRRVQGSNFNDTMSGGDFNDQFTATLGYDTYDGNGGSNVLRYDFLSGYRITATAGNPSAGLYGLGTATIVKSPTASGTTYTDTATDMNQFRGTSANDAFVGTDATYSYFTDRFRGDAGNDTFDGRGSTNNRVEYTSSPAAVFVDLAAGTAQDGYGGTDTLTNVRAVQGSDFNDTLLGSSFNDAFVITDAGQHTINGREGVNAMYFAGTGAVTIDLGTTPTSDGLGGYAGTITKAAGTDSLANIANAQGGFGNDILRGTPGDNQLVGGAGNNTIDGRGGFDTVNYRFFSGLDIPLQGATVNLADGVNGVATNPYGGTDTLLNIEFAFGTQLADDLTGANLSSGAISYIRGEGGNDILRAPLLGTHVTADYLDSLSAVTVNLSTGQTTNDGWFGGQDTLVNIQSVRGSGFADTFYGSSGNDTIDGAGGVDLVDYSAATGALTVNLQTGSASGSGIGTDTLVAIEKVTTGSGADTVTGDGLANLFTLNAGNDTVFAGAGADTLLGGADNDTLVGASDIFALETNYLDGGAGDDTLYAGAGDSVIGGSGFDVLHIVNSYAFSLDLGGSSIEYVLSDYGNDIFNAATQTQGVQIYSGGGNDLVTGSGLADVVFAGPGADTVSGGEGNDTIIGDVGADSLSGGGGDDLMYVDSSDVFIDGGAGTDAVFITGVPGDPGMVLDMAASHLEFAADFAGNPDSISALNSSVATTVYANAGNDTIAGGSGADFLWGEAGDDTISGGGGNDVLVGGQGSDRLIGGAGIDALYGNSGGGNDGAVDTFVFTPGSGTDIVFDFIHSQDKLDMKAYGTDFSHITIVSDSGNAAIYFDGTTFVASIAGNAGQITSSDFLFV